MPIGHATNTPSLEKCLFVSFAHILIEFLVDLLLNCNRAVLDFKVCVEVGVGRGLFCYCLGYLFSFALNTPESGLSC